MYLDLFEILHRQFSRYDNGCVSTYSTDEIVKYLVPLRAALDILNIRATKL